MTEYENNNYFRYSATGLARTACGYGVETCVNQAKDLFKKWMENPQKNR